MSADLTQIEYPDDMVAESGGLSHALELPADPFGAPNEPSSGDGEATTAEPTAPPVAAASPQNAVPPPTDQPQPPGAGGEDAGAGDRGPGPGGQQQAARPGDENAQFAELPVTAGWALEGVRSLNIDLTNAMSSAHNVVTFKSLGVSPRLAASVIDRRRLDSLVWGLALVVVACGLCLLRCSGRTQAWFIVLMIALLLFVPPLIDQVEFSRSVVDLIGTVVFLLAVLYIAKAVVSFFVSRLARIASGAAVAATVMLLIASGGQLNAQEMSASELVDLIKRLAPQPVTIPKDAVIVPFRLDPDGDLTDSLAKADQVFVPYEKYVELWNRANPNQKLTSTPPPAEYAFSGAAYTATLADGDEWVVQGTISIDLFVERPILVPLPLQSGVVAAATLDGEPAKLTVIQPAPANAEPKQQDKQAQMEQQAAPAAGGPVLALQVSGKGRKELALTIRFRVNRQGGWRRVGGRLPSAPATSLTLTAPALDTEIRLSGVQDRSQWQTTEANQTIETALATGGQFALQWRPQVAQGVVDQSLTANSQVALHIQEDGLRAVWIANLEFRQGRRTTFSFTIPTDYVIERVEGANIRGWTTEVQDDQRRIEVTLLKEAVDRESVQLQTAKRGAVGVDELREFDGPVVGIPEAALHQGSLIIRRSPHLNLRIANLRGVVQTDIPDNLPAVMSIESGPLGVRDFQAYEFSMTPFQLRLAATPITTSTAKTSARLQTLLRLAADDAALESRILIESPDRSIYRLHVRIPAALDVAQVAAPGLFDWSVTGADDQRTLNLFLNEGQRGSWSVALNGSLGERQGDQPLDIPRLEVLNVRRQEGDIVVQADPGYRVDSSNLNGIQATQLETQASGAAARVQQWLAAKQRTLARLALTYQQPNYSGQLVTTRRNSQITCTTVTNVRVSDQTIEETILLQFKVRHAGVRELTFLAPATLAAARVQAPLLRRKTIEPIEDNEDQIRFRLELQEEVMGDILIVVERDRLHTSDEQFAPLPTIESEFAETLQQYVTLENASRDELVITQNEGVEPLSRQTAPAMLANADLNRAYVVKGAAVFAFQAKRRETVQTVGARIGLSEISLMVDANGAYRGIQTLHIDNRTEQYLEIELPAGAALWTARVAGASVKPAQSAAGAQLFRLPLIKTAAGDPDYSVEIKYGGQLPPIANWRTVKFPLPRTHNINVELSQVRLFLPESFRWDKFGGSLKQVDDAAELDAGYVTYVNRQIEKATQTLLVGSDYDRARATSNLKKLQVLSGQLRDYNKSNLDNENVQEQVDLNAQVLERAERTIREQEYESQELGVDNRIRFNDLFTRQKNERSRNVVESFGNNFSYSESGGKPGTKLPGEGKGGAFDKEWLSRNQLKSDKGSGGKGPAGKADDAKQGASKSRVQTNRKQLGNNREQLEQRLAAPQTKPQKEKSEAERQTRQTEPQRRSQSSKELANEYKMRLDRLSQLGWTSGQAGQQGQSQQGVQSGRRSDVDDRDGSRVSGGGIGGGGGGFGVDGRGRGFGEGAANAEEVPHAIASGVVPDFGEQTTLASLDIDMPMDGESYFFVTPRGELEIEARVIEDRLVDRGIRLILAIVVLLVAGVVMRLTRRRSS
ncbi:MAG: hypothetical protein QF805_08950 [Pirellulaceae bacterium]|nr:hypothetical protein [Pirellulaceae bacterium]